MCASWVAGYGKEQNIEIFGSVVISLVKCIEEIVISQDKHCGSKTSHGKDIYQSPRSPLILTELFQHNLINVSYLTACYLYQVMMTLHFLSDVANDAESTKKN